MNKTISFVVTVATVAAGCWTMSGRVPGGSHAVTSPDGRNEIRLWTAPLAYEVRRDGVVMAAKSEIALTVDGIRLFEGRGPIGIVRKTLAGKVQMPVYKKASIDLSGEELFVDFGDGGVRLVARNDGVAYRFETRRTGEITVNAETAGLVIPDGNAPCRANFTWGIGCEESVSEPHTAASASVNARKYPLYLPFVYQVGGKSVAVTESDVHDYPIWNLRGGAEGLGAFAGQFAAWPKKTRRIGGGGSEEVAAGGRWVRVTESENYLVRTTGERTFPWRTFVLADTPSDFCAADIVAALARGQVAGDFGWVRPGKVAWDWWNDFDNLGAEKGCTTRGYERFIDFAASNGIEYVIFDEGWTESLDIWKFSPRVDVPRLIDYANKKGVGIILWMAWAQVYGEEEKVAAHFARLGAKGFKIDFMDRGDAECERFLWAFAEACRKHKMLVDYHGTHRPTGLSRAYPNVLNFEGVHGLESMKWYDGKYDFMQNDLNCFYLRMTAGPMDYTPGAMLNYPIGGYKGTCDVPGSVGTRSRQMALMALYEAPLQMLCDSPTNYENNMESFAFMAKVPVVWDDTVPLGGSLASYAAVARRKGGVWYAAGIGNACTIDAPVDTKFLGEGTWTAEIFRDDMEASDKDPQKYVHETKSVKAGDLLCFRMARGGGFIVRFSK